MYSTAFRFFLVAAFSSLCFAQTWEVGVEGGYGWYSNPSLTNSPDSGSAGFPPRAAVGVVFGEDLYSHLGGEVRWLFRFGGPQLRSNGITESALGYTNTVTYDFLFHMTPRESKIRPFVAAGAGIKVYTGSFRDVDQPLANFAVLRPVTQVEPALSVGGGVKYLLPKHIQLRMDFRVLMTPLPDDLIRPTRPLTRIHGWVYDFLPLAGLSYIF
jgi:hypothetical protein